MSNSTKGPSTPLDEWAVYFTEGLHEVPVVAILRGLSPEESVQRARQAWELGIRLVEVTVESEAGLEALAAVLEEAGPHHDVGAGTVTTPERLADTVSLGAAFAVAPDLNPDTVCAATDAGVPLMPGVATPSEVGMASRMGLSVLKAFPASALGPGWIRAIRGPFPEVSLVATGGIGRDNVIDFLDAGAVGVGLSAILDAGFLEHIRGPAHTPPPARSAIGVDRRMMTGPRTGRNR